MECVAVVGLLVDEILEQSVECDADYIILGSRGHVAAQHFLSWKRLHRNRATAYLPDDRHPRKSRQLEPYRREAAKGAGPKNLMPMSPWGALRPQVSLVDKAQFACSKGRSVVVFVFLVVGLLFSAALAVAFFAGWLDCRGAVF